MKKPAPSSVLHPVSRADAVDAARRRCAEMFRLGEDPAAAIAVAGVSFADAPQPLNWASAVDAIAAQLAHNASGPPPQLDAPDFYSPDLGDEKSRAKSATKAA